MFTLTASQLLPALKRVALAASEDEKRPVLWNVLLTGTPKGITLYAADGFRLHFATIAAGTPAAVRLIIDSAAVKAILKVKTTRKNDPEITFDPEAGTITCSGSTLGGFWNEKDGNYPDVNYIIPTKSKIQIEVNPQDLLAAVKIARVFAREESNVCKLSIFTDGTLIATGKSEETGESHTTVKLIDHCGTPYTFVIGFNCDFLIDALKSCTSKKISIGFNQKNSPALLTDADGFSVVIMPMHLDPGLPAEPKTEEQYKTAGAYVYPDSYSCAVTEAYDSTQQNAPARVAFEESTVRLYEEGAFFSNTPTFELPAPTPEAGAQEYDIVTIFSALLPGRKTSQDVREIVLHLANGRPDPDAPIPAEGWPTPNRHPHFNGEGETYKVGECDQCLDGPHCLTKNDYTDKYLCTACYESAEELRRQYVRA